MKLLALLTLLVAAPVYASPRVPQIVAQTTTRHGALFLVRNPTRRAIRVAFVCTNAFSTEWLEVPAHTVKTIELSPGEPIADDCKLRWRPWR